MKSFDLRASTEDIEEAEGMTGEFVLTAGHLAYQALSKKVILDLGAAMTAAAERMEELAKLRAAVDAVPTTTLRFWLATRHIEGFDPATEFCRLALEMRGEEP